MNDRQVKHLIGWLLVVSLCGCKQGGQIQRIKKSEGAETNATPGLVDVVIVVATSHSGTELQTKITSGIRDLTKDLSAGIGSGLKISLLAKDAASILSSSDLGIATSNVKAMSAQIQPSDVLIGALVAGCSRTLSSFTLTSSTALHETSPTATPTPKPTPTSAINSTTTPTTAPSANSTPTVNTANATAGPKICGQSLLSVEGNTAEGLKASSLATLAPIQESLVGFLRPGTARAYIIITDGNAEYIDGETLTTVVKAQNTGSAAAVYALAPTSNGASGDCAADTKKAERYSDVTHDTNGALYSFCDKEWETSLHAIVASIVKKK